MTFLNMPKSPVHSEPEIFISLYSLIPRPLYSLIPRLCLTFIKFL